MKDYLSTVSDKKNENFYPRKILETIGNFIKNDFHYLIRVLPCKKKFFRARINENDSLEPYINLEDIGPPSEEDAIYSNRMSPAGIPIFYGTLDEKTAINELYNPEDKPSNITMAVFESIRLFKVLDFSNYICIPSFFDRVKRNSIPKGKFLNSFIRDIVKPISKDGYENIEYIPTQVVTEYFRYIFKDNNGDYIRGIIYPSTKNPGGRNIALFFTQEECISENEFKELKGKPELSEKWLKLISSSIKIKQPGIIWEDVFFKH